LVDQAASNVSWDDVECGKCGLDGHTWGARVARFILEALKAERLAKVKVVQGGWIGNAEDVAVVVGWLVSEKARWQAGSVVAANSGAQWIGETS
jgi:hypothetical protein